MAHNMLRRFSRSRIVERMLSSVSIETPPQHPSCMFIDDAAVSLIQSFFRQKILTENTLLCRVKIFSQLSLELVDVDELFAVFT